MQQFFNPLDEFERLARNRPHPQVIAAKLPTVTDGTLAGIVQAQPRRIIQQLPTGRITSVAQPDLAPYVDFIWRNYIIPNARTSGDVLQKSWGVVQCGLVYGSQPTYAFFTRNGDYYGVDFTLPYIKDVFPEVGKLYANDSKYMFMRSWWTESQIRQLIDKEEKLVARSKARKEKDAYTSNWNLALLKKLLDFKKVKPQQAMTPAEREQQGTRAIYIELIHVFQEGIGAKFYTWSPDLKKTVRTRTNRDPRGRIPISYYYSNIDRSNPLGRGVMELSGAMQNLLDSEVQAYQLMQKIMLNPPLKKWGVGINKTTIKWSPNAVWDMGSDANAKLDPVEVNTQAIANFATNYGLMKSQIMNLTGNQDTSVSAQSGNPNFSKTQAGVQVQQLRLNIDDNFQRKQFETWFEANAETMLNIHFAESSGSKEIELTEDFIDQLNGSEGTDNRNVRVDPDKKMATVIYDKIKTRFVFEVNPSSSEAPDDETQIANLKELLTDAGTNLRVIAYFLGQAGYGFKSGELYRDLFQRLGVENIDRIMPKMTPEEADQAKQAPFPILDPPHVRINTADLPPAALLQALSQAGINVPPEALAQPPDASATKAPKSPTETLNYKDAPEDVKRQIEMQAGLTPSQSISPAGSQQFEAHASAMTNDVAPVPEAAAQNEPQPAPTPNALTPEDEQLIEQFVQAGFSEQDALKALALMHAGYSHDQIMQILTQAQGGAQ